MKNLCLVFATITAWLSTQCLCQRAIIPEDYYTEEHLSKLKSGVEEIFYHAYNGYTNYAYPLDELQPLTCRGIDTWGSFSSGLIDSLDTLIVMGNYLTFHFSTTKAIFLNNLKGKKNKSYLYNSIWSVSCVCYNLHLQVLIAIRYIDFPLEFGESN